MSSTTSRDEVAAERKRRREICQKCPSAIAGRTKKYICGRCNCVIAAKVLLRGERCPDGKW